MKKRMITMAALVLTLALGTSALAANSYAASTSQNTAASQSAYTHCWRRQTTCMREKCAWIDANHDGICDNCNNQRCHIGSGGAIGGNHHTGRHGGRHH